MRKCHESQAILIAVGICPPPCLIAAEGDAVFEAVDDCGSDLGSLDWDRDDVPDEHGLHVWEGTLIVDSWEDQIIGTVVELAWEGKWRRATAADLARFGMALEP